MKTLGGVAWPELLGTLHGGHTTGMKSRVHPTYKTKYRVANWASYDRALVRRGDVTLWVSPEAIASWEPTGVGTRGGQWQYSDLAIGTALTLRLIFHLPFRQTEGFLTSLFGLMGLDLSAPDHRTLSRRGQYLDLTLRRVPTSRGFHLIVDSTDCRSWAKGGGPLPNTVDAANAGGRSSIWVSTHRV